MILWVWFGFLLWLCCLCAFFPRYYFVLFVMLGIELKAPEPHPWSPHKILRQSLAESPERDPPLARITGVRHSIQLGVSLEIMRLWYGVGQDK